MIGARWVPLMHGKFAIVDDADYATVAHVPWHVGGGGYATARIDGQLVLMHWLIAGKWRDHVSRDRLDNRRSNLRLADRSQNNFNKTRRCDNKHGFVGVSYDARRKNKPWSARVTAYGKDYSAGYHATLEDAAAARDALAQQVHGEFARPTLKADR